MMGIMAARRSTRLLGVSVVVALTVLVGSGSTAAPSPTRGHRQAADAIRLGTLPIANALPLDLGIQKGFFSAQNIEIKKTILQSGNDIVLGMGGGSFDIGYVGYVPAMIARTTGIPLTIIAASEVEGTSDADNWQNIVVKGSSSIKTPADLAGKTIAVNALKGVGEVVIRASLKKLGVDPSSIKLLALPFPAMRTALSNGQVDAIWTPEPFLTQALTIDGARIVLAPGPTLGNYFPNGGYVALTSWTKRNPGVAKRLVTAINESLTYARTHPDEIRALLPATSRNVRLPVWSPLIDRVQLLQLAKYAKEFGVISTLPNMTQLAPSSIRSGTATGTIEVTVGPGSTIAVKQAGAAIKRLDPGRYLIIVKDQSSSLNFHLVGPGLDKKTGVGATGTSRWSVTLKPGSYRYSSDAGSAKGSFRVS
jgi:NitT/TauT family transport system substrate-binding protein